MARVNLLSNATRLNTAVTGNGVFRLYESGLIPVNNNNAMEVVAEYSANLPDPNQGIGITYQLFVILETSDGAGGFYAFHRQLDIFNSVNNGATHIISMNPKIFLLNEGTTIDIWDGSKVITRLSKSQGVVPAEFRIALCCRENGFGGAGAFQQVDLTLAYDLTTV